MADFTLQPDERKAILAGDTRALRRQQRPPVTEGQVKVLVWSKGGTQFLEKSVKRREEAAEDGKPLTVGIPRKPTLWVTFKEPALKDGVGWIVEFTIHDHREPTRMLAPAPSPNKNPGLRTRWNQRVTSSGAVVETKPKKRGEERESWTPETERGYGGGGRSAVDEREGVDDEYLKEDRLKRNIDAENALKQSQQRLRQQKLSVEFEIAASRRRGKGAKRQEEQLQRIENRLRKAA